MLKVPITTAAHNISSGHCNDIREYCSSWDIEEKSDIIFLVIGLNLCNWYRVKFANPGVTSLIRARPHTFVEIDHELFSMVILLPPLFKRSQRMCNEYWLTA